MRNTTIPHCPLSSARSHRALTTPTGRLKKTRSGAHFINGAPFWIDGDISRFEPLIQRAFAEVDPNLAITDIHPLQQQIDVDYHQQRTVVELSTLSGSLAILLPTIGLYGVMI